MSRNNYELGFYVYVVVAHPSATVLKPVSLSLQIFTTIWEMQYIALGNKTIE